MKGRFGDAKFALPFARIENHYFTNKGFFPLTGHSCFEKEIIARLVEATDKFK